jgi:hypothetical protein
VLVGELPSPRSQVVVTTGNGDRIPADTMEGRLWTCEWPAPPLSATITVDGGTAVAVSFFQRRPRVAHYAAGQLEERPAIPGKVVRGWYRHASEEPGQ